MPNKLRTEEWIARGRSLSGERYQHSCSEYLGSDSKVIIGCPEHGWFEQSLADQADGLGCSECAKACEAESLAMAREAFLQQASKLHAERYDYSKVESVGEATTITVICPEHGEFDISPHKHSIGQGCTACATWFRA